MGSWIQTSNFVLFVVNGLIKGEIEKPSGQFLGLIVMSHLLDEVLCLLVSWCAGGRCGMTCSDKECGRSRRPAVEDRGWSHMVYTVHMET
jgi:hypothetical protein